MTFYKIDRSIEPRIVGVKDGSSQAELVKKSFSDKKKYEDYLNYFLSYNTEGWFDKQTKLPVDDFDLQNVSLKKQALFTDFIYFAPSFYHKYLVSKKAQSILSNYRLPPFKYYEAKIYSRDEINVDYKFLFSPSLSYDFVDFEKCLFSKGNNPNKEYVKVNSMEEFVAIEYPLNRERIVLKSNFNSEFDYFNLLISPESIISERLAESFLENKVSGINLIKMDKSQFEIQ